MVKVSAFLDQAVKRTFQMAVRHLFPLRWKDSYKILDKLKSLSLHFFQKETRLEIKLLFFGIIM